MQVRDIDAKVAAIGLEEAKKIGLDLSGNSSVSINGSVVDIEFIDELSNDWRLPKIYLKAQAYLTTLKEPKLKSYVRLISNKFENFKRISSLTEVEELAYSKVAKFCDENNFGLHETIDEVIYGKTQSLKNIDINDLINELNKKVEAYNNNVTEYQELCSNNEEDNELIADALAKCKISIILVYRDFSLIQAVIENSPFQSYNYNVYDNCPFCHNETSCIDKNKLIYIDGNKVYYRRPGVDPSEYTKDDIIYVLSDEEIAEMFGDNESTEEVEEVVEKVEKTEENKKVEVKESKEIIEKPVDVNNSEAKTEEEVEEVFVKPEEIDSEEEVIEDVEEKQSFFGKLFGKKKHEEEPTEEEITIDEEPEYEAEEELVEEEPATYEEPEYEVEEELVEEEPTYDEPEYDEQVDIPNYSEEDESLLENSYDNEYSNYDADSEYNNIKEPTTEFEKLLFYSNENTPVVVNFISSQQENIIKKSTIVEWVDNEIRSETIRLTDVDNSVISDTLKINDAIDSSKQYTHGFEFENITKHFIDGLEDDNGNTRVVINDKHGNTISLTELFDNEKEESSK